jgi:hypothetical protein
LAAAASGVWYDYIYTSINGGVSWVERVSAGKRFWTSIDSSSDGLKLIACSLEWMYDPDLGYERQVGGYIYISTNGGVSWVEKTDVGRQDWNGVKSSGDGNKLFAWHSLGAIKSDDGGLSWSEVILPAPIGGLAYSDDGMTMLLTDVQSAASVPWLSTDRGASWTKQCNAKPARWMRAAMNSSGGRMAIIEVNGIPGSLDNVSFVYTSE